MHTSVTIILRCLQVRGLTSVCCFLGRVDHNIKGQGIYAYVVLAKGTKATPELKKKLNDVVRNQIGSFAVPDTIHWAPGESSRHD